jgi:hypothetical protein
VAPAARSDPLGGPAGRRLLLVPAAVHQPRRRLDVGEVHELDGGGHPAAGGGLEPGDVPVRRGQHDAGADLRAGDRLDGDDDGGLQHGARRCGDLPRAHLCDELLVGLLPLAHVGLAPRVGSVQQLRQAGPAGPRPCPAALRLPAQRRAGDGRARRGGRPRGGRRRTVAADAQPGECRPPRPGHRALGLGDRPALRSSAGAGLGPGDDEVPRPDGAAAARPLALDHPRHPGQPPVAVRRPAARAPLHRGGQRSGQLDRGTGCLRLRPPPDRHPVHPWRARRRRAGPDHGAERRRRSARDGRGGCPDLPGADLRPADPARADHLCDLAAQQVVAPRAELGAPHRTRPRARGTELARSRRATAAPRTGATSAGKAAR